MAETRDFDIHGLLRVRIRGLARFAVEDLNVKLLPFEKPFEGEPDLSVDIGPFDADRAWDTHVDHQYFLRRNHVSFREDLPGFSFAAEIEGLERGPAQVRFHRLRVRPGAAGLLYRDQICFDHVLQPLLEWMLGRKGVFLLHGGAVARDGKAHVLVGRGGSFKTTHCFHLVSRGFDFLGDDLLLFDRERILPFPLYPRYFDFHLAGSVESEKDLQGAKRFMLLRHLYGTSPLSYRVGAPSRPATLILLHPRAGLPRPLLTDIPRDEALAKTGRNIDMERSSIGPAKYQAGRFLDAYAMAYPDHPYRRHRQERDAALAGLFSEAKPYLLQTDTRWHAENLDVLQMALGDG
jgi:hypothetical protein